MKQLLIAVSLLGGTMLSQATSYTFQPSPADLNDLDHYRYYKWGVNASQIKAELEAGAQITSATLTINDIKDWRNEPDNLWIHLLDYARLGVSSGWDHQGNGDQFNGQGPLIANYQYPDVYPQTFTLNYELGSLGLLDELTTFILNDGRVGLGFDPDCHYFNNGVSFNVKTASQVPEGGLTAWLLGMALMGVEYARRRVRA